MGALVKDFVGRKLTKCWYELICGFHLGLLDAGLCRAFWRLGLMDTRAVGVRF